jgi:hypothetical protein
VSGVTLDFSRAVPLPKQRPVVLDFSRKQPVAAVTPRTEPAPTGSISAPDPRDMGAFGAIHHFLQQVQEKAEGGTTPATASFIASPVTGALKVIESMTDPRPVRSAKELVSGGLEAATLPSMVAGGPGTKAALEAIPNAGRAAQLFQTVEQAAGNVPVTISHAAEPLAEAMRLRGAGNTAGSGAISKLVKRINDVAEKGPLTYQEARRYYNVLSKLSASDRTAIAGTPMGRQLGIITNALKHDIGDAAAQVNQASNYYQGMREYARAAKLKDAAKDMLKWTAGAVGVGAGVEGINLAHEAISALRSGH